MLHRLLLGHDRSQDVHWPFPSSRNRQEDAQMDHLYRTLPYCDDW
jgi:hypothetical protein